MQIKDIKDMTGFELRELATEIRKAGHQKSYEVFKQEMQVLVDEINRRGITIAKKHNRKYNPVNVIQMMRG